MASMRDIQRRKSSVASIGQITKAMKLVSTVKLQKTKVRAEKAKPYFEKMYRTVAHILSRSGNIDHVYLKGNDSPQKCIIVITSNRGLAGGYNSGVEKLITGSDFAKEDVELITIGRKGKDFLERRGYAVREDHSDVINEPMFSDAKEISDVVLKAYENGEIGEIYLAYTSFKNTVVHEPQLMKLLPMKFSEEEIAAGTQKTNMREADMNAPMNYEPEEEEALGIIVPKYVTSIVFGALIEATASENGARMQAMDNATSNAQEMMDKLSLQYNRARQGSITQELTEIIAGAEAIN